MPARLFSRIKKIKTAFSYLPKAIIFSLVLVATLLSSALPLFAQNAPYDSTFRDYETLFSQKDSGDPIFGRSNWIFDNPNDPSLAKKVEGVVFTFKAKFNTTDEKKAGWFWDHIVSLDNQPKNANDAGSVHPDAVDNAFLVRVCPKSGATLTDQDKSNCLFQSVLYSDHPLVPSACTSTNMSPLVCNTQIIAPLYTETIYQHPMTITSSSYDYNIGENLSEFGVNIPVKFALNPGTYQADMWYCPGAPQISGNSSPKPPQSPNIPVSNDPDIPIQDFGDRCHDHRGYFRIGTPITFEFPKTAQDAINGNTSATDPAVGSDTVESDGDVMPHCHILNGWGPGSGSFVGCIAYVVYYGIFWPIKWFAGIMGKLFDFFIGYSLDDASYRADFAVRGWRLVRDISNVFFIVILIWTGLMAVFKTESTSMKKVIPNLIVNALIINFSLFATRVVIDISNIGGRLFYNAIHVEKKLQDGTLVSIDTSGPGGYKPLSDKIVSGFDPQKVIKPNFLTNKGITGGGVVDSSDEDKTNPLNTNAYATVFVVVSLIAGFVLFATAMMFWKTAFFFLGRTIGLYISMIFSPFAFLTQGNMPILSNIKELSWKNWISELLNYATLAPIFAFFLYIIYLFVNSDFVKVFIGEDTGRDFMTTVISISIPLLIVYFLIDQGVKIAKNYSGEVGKMVQKYTNTAVGFAGGAALGATAVVGSRVVGGIGRSLDRSKFGVGIRNMAAKGGLAGWIGKRVQSGLNQTQSGSFDVRQSALGQKLFQQMDVNTNQKGLDTLRAIGVGPGLSVEQRKGGLDAAIKRRSDMREEEAKLLDEKMDVDAYNNRKKKHYENIKSALEKAVDKEIVKSGTMTAANLATLKKNDPTKYSELKANIIGATKDSNIKLRAALVQKGPDQIRSADEMNSSRRKAFVDNLKAGSLLTQGIEEIANTGVAGEGIAGAIGVTIGTTVGALIGQQIETAGDRKAAKKIGERSKIEKEIAEVKDAIEKGFKDLVAIEMFQAGSSFTKLTADEKEAILKGNKSMYDILEPKEKAAVDAQRFDLSDKQKEEYYDKIANRYSARQVDMKELNKKIKVKEKEWQTAADTDRLTRYQELEALLKEKSESNRLKKQFDDYREFIRKEKEKLKPKDDGK